MRGCFRIYFPHNLDFRVLPAYAGMFLRTKNFRVARTGSPRVCGDVSVENLTQAVACEFSPRMRGCFRRIRRFCFNSDVLPAYAGMFPGSRHPNPVGSGSPRVCGDVSRPPQLNPPPAWFSPRMRGCFHREGLRAMSPPVLPAYAGMFLHRRPRSCRRRRSPRVCGDVS